MTGHTPPPDRDGSRTLAPEERVAGMAGPPPLDDRTEIRWSSSDGVEVVVKAGSGILRDRLRREAEVLQRCAGLPTVRLLEIVEGADHTELVTARFGLFTLDDARLMSPAERGTALARLCRAVAELHSAGWAHGSITASHVLVGPGSRVRLCSVAEATSPTGRTERNTAARRDDRAALVAVVTDVLAEPATFGTRREQLRWNRTARRATTRIRRLEGLPTAEELVVLLVDAGVPGAAPASPGSGHRGGKAKGHDRPARRIPAGVIAVLVVLAATAGVFLARWSADAVESTTPGQRTRSSTASATPRCAPAPAAPAAGPDPAGVMAVSADIDGDGCPESVGVTGQVVTVGSRRYRVGIPGDIVAVGDWDCDGRATVASLRPSTGEVFDFTDWATSGADTRARVVAEVDGGVSIVAPAEACGPPSVLRADGTAVRPAAPPTTTGG